MAWVILHFVYLLIGWRTFGVFLVFFPSFAVMDNGSFVHKFLGGHTSSWSATAGSHVRATFELPETTMPLPEVAASLYSPTHDARKGSSFPSPLHVRVPVSLLLCQQGPCQSFVFWPF